MNQNRQVGGMHCELHRLPLVVFGRVLDSLQSIAFEALPGVCHYFLRVSGVLVKGDGISRFRWPWMKFVVK